ncbi:MAG: nuclear transport factor 2 family protein [Cyclobacteriaceae bacterium]|nr:nuclear transport factor 2 family protein [Cyclobacteriaceae bacterium]
MRTLFLIIMFIFSLESWAQSAEEILKLISEKQIEAASLVDQQLEGYNERDIEKFLAPYSDDVEVYTFPNTLKYKGKDKLRESYEGSFARLVNRKATITKRIVYGSNVVDHEEITGLPNNFIAHAVALYVIENGKIAKVYFLKQM